MRVWYGIGTVKFGNVLMIERVFHLLHEPFITRSMGSGRSPPAVDRMSSPRSRLLARGRLSFWPIAPNLQVGCVAPEIDRWNHCRGRKAMRSIAEYLGKAAEFDRLAVEGDAPLKKRYADLAECYRLLAQERKRLIDEGAIPSERTRPGDGYRQLGRPPEQK